MTRISSTRTRRWLAAGAALIGIACAERAIGPRDATRSPITITATLTAAQQATIAGMSVEVTGPGITTPILATLNVAGATVNGTVQVPVGASRIFTVRAFDAQGTETYEGSATATVVAGTNPPLTVRMTAREGTVPIDVTVGTYGVTLTPPTASVLVDAEVTLTANVTSNGSTVPGAFTWGVVNPALVTLTVAPDGRSAIVRGRLAGSTRVVASYEGTAAASTITITAPANQPPVASVNGPYTGTAGAAINFSSAGSADADGTIASYLWNFGDGTTSGAQHPSKSYASTGTYTVTLTVTDDDGAMAAASTTATIVTPPNQSPTVTISGPSAAVAGAPVRFTATGTDSDGTIVQYRFSSSDDATPVVRTANWYERIFSAPGTYTVSVVAVDDDGAESQVASTTVSIAANQPPVAVANGPYVGTVGISITFSSAGSSDPEGMLVRREWLFGDGTGADIANPTKTYTAAGTYTVTLRVVDMQGASSTATTTATIAPPPNQPPTVSIAPQFFGRVGQPVTISAGCTDPDGTVASWSFSFSDGLQVYTSTTGSIQHTFAAVGTYGVSVNCWDNQGAPSQAKSAIVTINP